MIKKIDELNNFPNTVIKPNGRSGLDLINNLCIRF